MIEGFEGRSKMEMNSPNLGSLLRFFLKQRKMFPLKPTAPPPMFDNFASDVYMSTSPEKCQVRKRRDPPGDVRRALV